jgi:hypothetical protein
MERRSFIAASTAAAAVTASSALAAGTAQGTPSAGGTLLLELRRYRLLRGTMQARFGRYAKEALLPALGRAGVAPVGAWDVMLGGDSPTLHLLLPHKDAGSLATLADRVEADAEYRKAAAELLALPAGDPPFVRCDSSLIATVPTFPGVEKPVSAPGRIFELRTYRSHSEPSHRKKVDMFEAQGELAIFRRVGLNTVFFGRDLVGEGLPSLTYLLAFADNAAREKAWAAFGADPEWQRIRGLPGYSDPDIVSGITAALLRPTDYSQI